MEQYGVKIARRMTFIKGDVPILKIHRLAVYRFRRIGTHYLHNLGHDQKRNLPKRMPNQCLVFTGLDAHGVRPLLRCHGPARSKRGHHVLGPLQPLEADDQDCRRLKSDGLTPLSG
jgi:hypothetical protein